MDAFSMPEAHIGKEVFLLRGHLCGPTQRLHCSLPVQKKGLLAKEVAVMMACHCWRSLVFPVPFAATVDEGSQADG